MKHCVFKNVCCRIYPVKSKQFFSIYSYFFNSVFFNFEIGNIIINIFTFSVLSFILRYTTAPSFVAFFLVIFFIIFIVFGSFLSSRPLFRIGTSNGFLFVYFLGIFFTIVIFPSSGRLFHICTSDGFLFVVYFLCIFFTIVIFILATIIIFFTIRF